MLRFVESEHDKMVRMIMTAITFSKWAYMDPATIERKIWGGLKRFKWIENKNTDTQVFICEDKQNTWVVFRGTEFDSFDDWITNLDCSFTKGSWGDVHTGFYDDIKSVEWDIILHLMENVIFNKRTVIFTGHSQGAADAQLFFSELMYRLPHLNSICIPIESPRCMSKKAAEKFGRAHGPKIERVVNNNDIVTRVPTRLMGYSHVENSILNYLDEDGELHHDLTQWEMFLDRVKGRIYDFGEWGTDGIKDHSIDEVQRIWRNLL